MPAKAKNLSDTGSIFVWRGRSERLLRSVFCFAQGHILF